MRPAATLAGRVVDVATGAPVANMVVRTTQRTDLELGPDGIRPVEYSSGADFMLRSMHSAATRTDVQGRYELRNLPAGVYDVWAAPAAAGAGQAPQFNLGVPALAVVAGHEPVTAPDLVVGPGVRLRGQIIDGTTGQPLRLGDGARAFVYCRSDGGPTMKDLQQPIVPVSPEGTFEARVAPGKFRAIVFVYTKDSPPRQAEPAYRTPDNEHSAGKVYAANHGDDVSATITVWSSAELDKRREAFRPVYELMTPNATPEQAEKVIAALTAALARYPDDHEALLLRGGKYQDLRQYSAAVADWEKILQIYPGDLNALMALADALATCPDANVRNGRRAVDLAEVIVESMRSAGLVSQLPRALTILAAAQAEAGDFPAAVKTQQEAIAMAPVNRQAELEARLRRFERGQPHHDQ
jgi:hypothetical protein